MKVEVLNATTIRGLARRATFHLRDLGFDVVNNGNSNERHDTTVVIHSLTDHRRMLPIEKTAELIQAHPEHAAALAAFAERQREEVAVLTGPVVGAVWVLRRPAGHDAR